MKRIISIAVLLGIIMTTMFNTSVYYGASEDTVLFEDFGTNFSVDYGKGEIVSTKSGITYTTGSGAFPNGKTVISAKDGAPYVKARQSGVSGADVNMNFDKATGRVYLACDFRICGWETYNFMSGQDILRIGDENGNNVASLFIDCTSSSGDSAYWVKTKSSQSHKEDSYTVGKLTKNGKGYSSYVRIEYIIDIENKTYTVIFDQKAKTFAFDSDSINSVSRITFPNNHQTAQWFNKDYMVDNVTVKINTGSLMKTVNFYENERLIKQDSVKFGSSVSFPKIGTHEGKYFAGWYKDAQGKESADLSVVTEDINVYAVYRPYVICEDFGISNTFSIDNEGKKIETDSGFSIFASDSMFEFGALKADNGVLTVDI